MACNKCLFCSNILDKNYSKLVDATLLEIIEVLFDDSEVKVEIGSGICNDCEEKLKVAFKFKGLCIYTEDILYPYVSGSVQSDEKIDLKTVYAKEKQCKEPDDGYVCRLCLEFVDETNKHLLLEILEKKRVKDTFKIYLPEVNLGSSEDPVICEQCLQSLNNFLDFVASSRPINNTGKVEPLRNLQEMYIKLEPLDIVSIKEEKDGGKRGTEAILKKFEKISGSGMFKCQLCSKECKTNQHMAKHMRSHLQIWFKCKVCSYKSRYQKRLEKHEIIHEKKVKELNIYKCDECEYSANYKFSIESHKQIHNGEILNCTLCSFQSRNKRSMRYHLLHHSNRVIYKCDICPFETSRSMYLKIHMKQRHSDLSQVKMYKQPRLLQVKIYKCNVCSYETHAGCNFKRHILIHKDNSEVNSYICYDCGAKAKYKYKLKEHILKYHMKQNESEITIHKCLKCPYENKNIKLLKRHLQRTHNNFSIYICELCDFKTKHSTNLASHRRIMHNDGAYIELFRCPVCAFSTAYRENLPRHMKKHKNEDQIKLHKCKICNFRCQYPYELRKHIKLYHSSNVKMLKCELCTFSTKYRTSINDHMKRHKDISEVDSYQCAKCSHKTITKSAMKGHMLVHKSTSEVKMYNCPNCSFKTKYKNNLPKHILLHSNAKDVERDQCKIEAMLEIPAELCATATE